MNETFDVEVGQVAALFSRLPSGELATSAVGNPFGFKGLPLDEETGFYYVRRRYYDPELGRFITPDPYGYVDGPAMTAHAMNNPVSYSDPMDEVAVVDNLAGGAFSVGVGATLNCTIGQCDLPPKKRKVSLRGQGRFLCRFFKVSRLRGKLELDFVGTTWDRSRECLGPNGLSCQEEIRSQAGGLHWRLLVSYTSNWRFCSLSVFWNPIPLGPTTGNI